MTASQRRYQYHDLLRHHSTSAMLLLQHEGGWMLPYRFDNEVRLWQSVEHINTTLHTLLNVHAMTLCCVETKYDAKTNTVQRVYEAWVCNADWVPPPHAQ